MRTYRFFTGVFVAQFALISTYVLGDATEPSTEQSEVVVAEELSTTETETAIAVAPTIVKEPFQAFTGKITKNKVRMRLHPSLDSAIIRELDAGELLAVVDDNEDFYAIETPSDIKAYIYRTYVLDGIVEGNHVNVRLAPDLNAAVIAQLNAGDPVQGAVAASDKRWLEIAPPKNTHFYVAKDYVQKVGDVEMITTQKKRISEANALYSAAKLASQTELQKPFDQINLDSATQKLNKIVNQYKDFPECVAKAKELLNANQNAYLKKQVVHIEGMAKSSSVSAQNQAKPASNLTVIHSAAPSASNNISSFMAAWVPVEKNIFETWLSKHPGSSIEEFYRQQAQDAISLKGILEPYNHVVKNRPGDYVLLSEAQKQPIAFLYSTQINLQEKLGQVVEMEVVQRDNHHFAFPAYFVLNLK